MPREYRLLSDEPLDLTTVVAAARDIDPGLRPRLLFGGWAVQLVDGRDIAVLTVEASRRLDDRNQAEQLLGSTDAVLPSRVDSADDAEPVWWTEASAPWGDYGEPGTRLIGRMALSLGARLVAEEGQ